MEAEEKALGWHQSASVPQVKNYKDGQLLRRIDKGVYVSTPLVLRMYPPAPPTPTHSSLLFSV